MPTDERSTYVELPPVGFTSALALRASVHKSLVGLLPQALREANIAVDKIRTIAITHTHIVHINELILPNGQGAFPQLSRLLMPEEELEMFRAEARLKRFLERAEIFGAGQRIGASRILLLCV